MCQVRPLQPPACHAPLLTYIAGVHPDSSRCLHMCFLPNCAARQRYVRCCHSKCHASQLKEDAGHADHQCCIAGEADINAKDTSLPGAQRSVSLRYACHIADSEHATSAHKDVSHAVQFHMPALSQLYGQPLPVGAACLLSTTRSCQESSP